MPLHVHTQPNTSATPMGVGMEVGAGCNLVEVVPQPMVALICLVLGGNMLIIVMGTTPLQIQRHNTISKLKGGTPKADDNHRGDAAMQ